MDKKFDNFKVVSLKYRMGVRKHRRFKCIIAQKMKMAGNKTGHILEGNVVTLSYRSNLVSEPSH